MHVRGLTTVEVIIVVAILGSIFSVSGVAYSKLQQSIASAVSDREVGHILGAAARRARSGVNNSSWGVYINYDEATRLASGMTMFAGSSYAARDTSRDIEFPLANSIQFTTVDFSGAAPATANSHEIVFAALSGATTQYGSLTVTWYGQSRTITVNSNGIPVR